MIPRQHKGNRTVAGKKKIVISVHVEVPGANTPGGLHLDRKRKISLGECAVRNLEVNEQALPTDPNDIIPEVTVHVDDTVYKWHMTGSRSQQPFVPIK